VVLGALAIAGVVWALIDARRGPSGPARSPEAAVGLLLTALEDEDPVALVAALAPDEVPALANLIADVEEQAANEGAARRAEPLAGLSVGVDDLRYDTELLDADVARVAITEGTVTVAVDAAELTDTGEAAVTGLAVADEGLEITAQDFRGRRALLDLGGVPEIITVQVDGGWYVSLLATVANGVTRVGDLPGLDVDRSPVEVEPQDDPEAAVGALLERAGAVGIEAAAASTARAERTVLAWFHAAIEEEVAHQQDDGKLLGTELIVDELVTDVREVDPETMRLLLRRASGSLRWLDDDDTDRWAQWTFDGSCLTIEDGGTHCLQSDTYASRAFRPDRATVVVVSEDDGWVVSPAATAIDLARSIVPQLRASHLLRSLGNAHLAAPEATLSLPSAAEVDLNEAGFAVVALEIAEPGLYSVFAPLPHRIGVWDAQGEPQPALAVGPTQLLRLEPGDHRIVVERDRFDGGAPVTVAAARVTSREELDLESEALVEDVMGATELAASHPFVAPERWQGGGIRYEGGDGIDGVIVEAGTLDAVCRLAEPCQLRGGAEHQLIVARTRELPEGPYLIRPTPWFETWPMDGPGWQFATLDERGFSFRIDREPGSPELGYLVRVPDADRTCVDTGELDRYGSLDLTGDVTSLVVFCTTDSPEPTQAEIRVREL
jgi:hypothetical protein